MRKGSAALLILVGCLSWTAAAGAGSAAATRVRGQESAVVSSDSIRLGDIAEVDGPDADLVRRLQAVALGSAPLPGRTRELDRGTVLGRMRQSGIDPNRVDVQVPPDIRVTRAGVTVGRDQVEAIIRDYVQQQIRGAGDDLRIKEIRTSESVVLPEGPVAMRVVGPKNIDWVGLIPLNVFLKVDGEAEKRLSATVNIEHLSPVVVARRPLGRYKPIDAQDIEVKRMDTAGLPADCITRPEMVIGKRTRRPLDSGSVLTEDAVESPPLVKYGDRVRIIAETAGLRISAFGQVKQKGARGDLIPVVNLDSNKVIQARVLDSQTVKIDF
jgi:flagella basal body P-ring formation protein FlgA